MDLFYRELGQGRPLIILHGLFGMSDNWMTFAKRLATNQHIFLVDLRNHGRSGHNATMSYPAMAIDVENFIKDKIQCECDVLGHSMGGKVAMTLALKNPKLVRSLVSVDIAPKRYYSSQFKDFLQVMMQMDLSSLSGRKEADSILQAKLQLHPATRQFLLKNIYRTENNVFAWRPNLAALFDNLDHLLGGIETPGRFEKPVLFAKGSESDYIVSEDFSLIRDYFPQAVIADIDGANHWVHSSAPAELESALRQFWM